MLYDVDRERRDNIDKELEMELCAYVEAYNESHRMMWVLNKDTEKREEKKKDLEAKVKEISVEKESLQVSIDAALLHQEDLVKAMSNLSDEKMCTYGVNFECTVEHIFFLYPNLDLSQIDFLKIVYGRDLVDEETVAFHKIPSPIEDTHVQDGAMDDCLWC